MFTGSGNIGLQQNGPFAFNPATHTIPDKESDYPYYKAEAPPAPKRLEHETYHYATGPDNGQDTNRGRKNEDVTGTDRERVKEVMPEQDDKQQQKDMPALNESKNTDAPTQQHAAEKPSDDQARQQSLRMERREQERKNDVEKKREEVEGAPAAASREAAKGAKMGDAEQQQQKDTPARNDLNKEEERQSKLKGPAAEPKMETDDVASAESGSGGGALSAIRQGISHGIDKVKEAIGGHHDEPRQPRPEMTGTPEQRAELGESERAKHDEQRDAESRRRRADTGEDEINQRELAEEKGKQVTGAREEQHIQRQVEQPHNMQPTPAEETAVKYAHEEKMNTTGNESAHKGILGPLKDTVAAGLTKVRETISGGNSGGSERSRLAPNDYSNDAMQEKHVHQEAGAEAKENVQPPVSHKAVPPIRGMEPPTGASPDRAQRAAANQLNPRKQQ